MYLEFGLETLKGEEERGRKKVNKNSWRSSGGKLLNPLDLAIFLPKSTEFLLITSKKCISGYIPWRFLYLEKEYKLKNCEETLCVLQLLL